MSCDTFTFVAHWCAFICVTCDSCMCGALVHSYVWYDAFIGVVWHVVLSICVTCDVTHACVGRWCIQICDMIHSCVWCDTFTCVTHWCAHSYVWHVTHARVGRCIRMCDITHSWVQCDTFTCVTRGSFMCTFIRAIPRIHACGLTHSNVWYDSFVMCDMTHIYVCSMTLSYAWYETYSRVCRDSFLHIRMRQRPTHEWVTCRKYNASQHTP